MAQYAFAAANYDNGVGLVDLGFSELNRQGTYPILVYTDNAVKVFRPDFNGFSANNTAVLLDATDGATDFEVLLLCNTPQTPNPNTRGQFGGAGRQSGNNFYGVDYSINYGNSVTKYPMVSTTTTATYNSITTNTAIGSSVYTKANKVGMRMSVVGTSIKSRIWASTGDLLADEPITWDFEATDSTHTAGKVGLCWREAQGYPYFTDIAIGTNGDSAILSPVVQTVTTPTNVVVSDITATTANVSWT